MSENTLSLTQNSERQEVELTSSENKILTLLFRANGEVVTKEKILQELWQTDEFIDANTLNVKMTRLRKKLGEVEFDKHIMTKEEVAMLWFKYFKSKIPQIGVFYLCQPYIL